MKTEIKAVISVSGKPIGNIYPDKVLEGKQNQNIQISEENLNTALNGDTVLVSLLPGQKAGADLVGKVEKVLKRDKIRFVGVLKKEEGKMICQTDDHKMYRAIDISRNDQGLGEEGSKVWVEMTKWLKPDKNPEGKIIKIIGKPGDHEVEMQAIMLDKGFVSDFPEAVNREAKKAKEEFSETLKKEIPHRRDMRDTFTITIDPKTAKDFDDAISLKVLDNDKYEIGIHIADVSFFVRPKTELDREASERATSVYLVDRTIPMLPEELSNNLCSLVPKEDRLTYSAIFEINKDGHISKEWFGRTVIYSDERLSYEEAQENITDKNGKYHQELNILNNVAKALRKNKMAGGAILFEDSEVAFELNDKMEPVKIYLKERFDAHLLIEDFMLLANKKVAEFVHNKTGGKDKTFVYRIHDVPDLEKIVSLGAFLKPLGYDLKIENSKISSTEINKMLKKAGGSPESFMVQQATVRAMSKAIYSTENIGHFGLAFKYYTHFTSPIRRYPDLLVHRLLDYYLKDEKPDKKTLDRVCQEVIHSSQREQKAAEAERESIRFKQTEYMQKQIGKTFDGVISGVAKFGIFVEELSTKTSGMVRLGSLNDFFEYDEKKYALVGKKTKKNFRLGDKVKIKVVGADPLKKMVDYEIVQ